MDGKRDFLNSSGRQAFSRLQGARSRSTPARKCMTPFFSFHSRQSPVRTGHQNCRERHGFLPHTHSKPGHNQPMRPYPTEVEQSRLRARNRTHPPSQAFSIPPFRTSDPEWLLLDEGFTLTREHEIESLFAIANGYIGNRGSLAEGSPLSAPATFVAGVFEQHNTPGSIPELMVLPDWTGVRVWIDDQPLSMREGEILEHRRILDFARGILWRKWRHRDKDGRITRLLAFRLASLADRHLLLQSVIV